MQLTKYTFRFVPEGNPFYAAYAVFGRDQREEEIAGVRGLLRVGVRGQKDQEEIDSQTEGFIESVGIKSHEDRKGETEIRRRRFDVSSHEEGESEEEDESPETYRFEILRVDDPNEFEEDVTCYLHDSERTRYAVRLFFRDQPAGYDLKMIDSFLSSFRGIEGVRPHIGRGKDKKEIVSTLYESEPTRVERLFRKLRLIR